MEQSVQWLFARQSGYDERQYDMIKTRCVKADEQTIREAGKILQEGGLVAFPTETVYGLGANALDEAAAVRTYGAKGRPSDNPLIVHIADIESLPVVARHISEEAMKLADRFWPGPLTMIFQKSDVVPYGTTGGLDTVAVRMPEHQVALELIRAAGGFVSAPSANTSGRPSPTCSGHVMDDLDGRIEMVLDGGDVSIGVESTIVDMTVLPPAILRPGAITKEMLEQTIGRVTVDPGIVRSDVHPKAPGMKYRHYAPKAPMVIVSGEPGDVVRAVNCQAERDRKAGRRTGVIASSETASSYQADIVLVIGTRGDEAAIARHLYGLLRQMDAEDVQAIYSESFSGEGLGTAIMNRLGKAAGHQIVEAVDLCGEEI